MRALGIPDFRYAKRKIEEAYREVIRSVFVGFVSGVYVAVKILKSFIFNHFNLISQILNFLLLLTQ